MSEMKLTNFSSSCGNIHEAVIAANRNIVYCHHQAPHAGATRSPAAGERLNVLLNSAHPLKLFYFIS